MEASKRLTGGIYKYESTYTLICFLKISGLDEDGIISLKYIDDVLKSDDSDDFEYNEIVGDLYASKANRLLFRGDYVESKKCFVTAREKLSDHATSWQIQVKDRVNSLIFLNRQDMVLETLHLSYPEKSAEEINAIYHKISTDK